MGCNSPSHSPGQCSFWQTEQRLLFSSDVMMRSPSSRFILPMAAATLDMDEAKRSIRKVAEEENGVKNKGHARGDLHISGLLFQAIENGF